MIRKAIVFQLLIAIMALFVLYPVALAGDRPADTPKKSDTAKTADMSGAVETWVVDLPEEDKWTSNYVHTTVKSKMDIYYPEGQTPGSWNEMLTVEALYSPKKNIAGLARQIYLGTVQGSPDATWDILKKGMDEQDHAFIVFIINCPDFLSGEPPQVQLWKLILTSSGLFTLQYSYRGEELPPARKDHILEIFDKAYVDVETAKE
jgi:hypothetical protein